MVVESDTGYDDMAGTSSTLLDGMAHHLSYNLFFNKMTSPRRDFMDCRSKT